MTYNERLAIARYNKQRKIDNIQFIVFIICMFICMLIVS